MSDRRLTSPRPELVAEATEPAGDPAAPLPVSLLVASAGRLVIPAGVGLVTLAAWELVVRVFKIQPYVIPGPIAIGQALVSDWSLLSHALWVTLEITGLALLAAVILGVGIAVLISQSRWLERIFFPYLVILQVTPIIAIAPLLILWVTNIKVGLLICAWMIAFFPIVSNTMVGLKSADHNLEDLFQLYRASRWQRLRRLCLPAAMPYFLSGLGISGGLALIGAVAAEFVAGTGGQGSGLAFRILEAGYQMNIPRMFAALALISFTGLSIHLLLANLSPLFLRKWHESAVKRER
jgi:NitT/TauT family transport system permease protein